MKTFGAAATLLAVTIAGGTVASSALAQQAGAQFPSFDTVDGNLDGNITAAELRRQLPNVENPQQLFDEADRNGNGTIDRQEWTTWRQQRTAGAGTQAQATGGTEETDANQIEVSLTDEIIEGKYITDAGLVGLDGNSLSFGALFSDDRDIVLSSELMASGLIDQWLPPFISLSLGGKLYLGLLDDPDDDNFAIAPGAEARVNLPLEVPMSVVGRIFYAPDIVTFGDSDTVIEFDTRFEVRFLPQTTGFVGYRVLNFEREAGGEDKIVNGIHAGIRFAF